MTRTLVDSTNVTDDPLTAQMVAYYIDGIYATTEAAVRARFPTAVLVPISAIGSNAGIVGDQEPGCMDIGQAITWVEQRRAASLDPTIYVNETYGWPGARQAFDAAGVTEPHWWVADYDSIAIIPNGAVAKQYENPTLTHGHFDLSIAADFWPGVDGGDMADDISIGRTLNLLAVGKDYSRTNADGTPAPGAVGDGKPPYFQPQLNRIEEKLDKLISVLVQAPSSPVGQDQLPIGGAQP